MFPVAVDKESAWNSGHHAWAQSPALSSRLWSCPSAQVWEVLTRASCPLVSDLWSPGDQCQPLPLPSGERPVPTHPPRPPECRASSPKTRAGPDQAHNVWAPAIQGGPGSIRPRRGSSRFHWAPPCTMMSTTHLQAVPTFKGVYQTSTVAQTSPLLSQL